MAVIIPLVITGGFHVDGFMDTVDAIRSYRSKEEKLEILKDPHIGSFAVIKFVTAGLFAFAGLLIILNIETKKGHFSLKCPSFSL